MKGAVTFWQGATLIVAALVLITIGYMFAGNFGESDDQARVEALKAVLQFGLVTSGGGLLLAYLNKRRDDEARAAAERQREIDQRAAEQLACRQRNDARRADLQELIIELGDAHRRLKIVKRQMRAQLLRADPTSQHELAPPLDVRADAFERAMEALLNAQIAAEEVRDRISLRDDLLSNDQILQVRSALKYGARYFHDVYQDYERCLVLRQEATYSIGPSCINLINFLTAKGPPIHLAPGIAAELEVQFLVLKNDDRNLAQRHDALAKIEKLRREDPERRRYRVVATECFALAADELRSAARQIAWERA
nr:hypothetical protein [uncultured Sphingomonas sp.]